MKATASQSLRVAHPGFQLEGGWGEFFPKFSVDFFPVVTLYQSLEKRPTR